MRLLALACAGLLLASASGCVTREVTVWPRQLERERALLLEGSGQAVLHSVGNEPVLVHVDDPVELVAPDGTRRKVILRDVLTPCPPHAGTQALCATPNVDAVVVGHDRDIDATVSDALLGVVLVGAIVAAIFLL